jgi:hypothetical protein
MFPFWIDYSSLMFWQFAPWFMGAITWALAVSLAR